MYESETRSDKLNRINASHLDHTYKHQHGIPFIQLANKEEEYLVCISHETRLTFNLQVGKKPEIK